MRRTQGISLIEVMIAVLALTVLTAIAVPAFASIADRVRIARLQTDLSDAFLTANRLAVAGGRATVLCPSGGAAGCDDGSDWSSGWLLFADVDGDRRFGGGDTFIRRGGAAGGLRVSTTGGRPRIVFQPDADSAGSNATFTVCAPGSGRSGTLVLANSGHFRLLKPDPGPTAGCIRN